MYPPIERFSQRRSAVRCSFAFGCHHLGGIFTESVGLVGGSLCLSGPAIHHSAGFGWMWVILINMGLIAEAARWFGSDREEARARLSTLPLRIGLSGLITIVVTTYLPRWSGKNAAWFAPTSWPMWLFAGFLLVVAFEAGKLLDDRAGKMVPEEAPAQ